MTIDPSLESENLKIAYNFLQYCRSGNFRVFKFSQDSGIREFVFLAKILRKLKPREYYQIYCILPKVKIFFLLKKYESKHTNKLMYMQ